MVNIEHSTLRALEQDVLPVGKRLVQKYGGLSHIRFHDARVRQILVADLLDRKRLQAVHLL